MTATPSCAGGGSMLTTTITTLSPQRVVLRVQPPDVVEMLERGVLAPDAVDAGDEREQRAVERPLLGLVLLGVQVLLRPLADGHVLGVLEAGIDAVAGRQRGGHDQPRLEGGSAPVLEVG